MKSSRLQYQQPKTNSNQLKESHADNHDNYCNYHLNIRDNYNCTTTIQLQGTPMKTLLLNFLYTIGVPMQVKVKPWVGFEPVKFRPSDYNKMHNFEFAVLGFIITRD